MIRPFLLFPLVIPLLVFPIFFTFMAIKIVHCENLGDQQPPFINDTIPHFQIKLKPKHDLLGSLYDMFSIPDDSKKYWVGAHSCVLNRRTASFGMKLVDSTTNFTKEEKKKKEGQCSLYSLEDGTYLTTFTSTYTNLGTNGRNEYSSWELKPDVGVGWVQCNTTA